MTMNTKNETIFDTARRELEQITPYPQRLRTLIDHIERVVKPYGNVWIGGFKDVSELAISFYNAKTEKDLSSFAEILGLPTENLEWLLFEQRAFKNILNDILSNQALSQEQLDKVRFYVSPPTVQMFQAPGSQPRIQRLPIEQMSPWLVAIFTWLINISNRTEIAPEKCQYNSCDKLIIPKPGGIRQKYCSDACKMKAYRKRKKITQKSLLSA